MKIVNIVLGLGTALILGALITLGIKTFYPEPTMPNNIYSQPYPVSPETPCKTGDTACQKRLIEYNTVQAEQQAAYTAYDNQMKIYNKDLFIIANVIGIIVFIIGFFTVLYGALVDQGGPIGIMLAGLWSIIYGYGRGWNSVDDRLKFFIGLVIALLVVGGSMWLLQRRAKERKMA